MNEMTNGKPDLLWRQALIDTVDAIKFLHDRQLSPYNIQAENIFYCPSKGPGRAKLLFNMNQDLNSKVDVRGIFPFYNDDNVVYIYAKEGLVYYQ